MAAALSAAGSSIGPTPSLRPRQYELAAVVPLGTRRKRRPKENAGLSQRRDNCDRRNRHRPDRNAVRNELQSTAGKPGCPIRRHSGKNLSAQAHHRIGCEHDPVPDKQTGGIGIGAAGEPRSYPIHERIGADGYRSVSRHAHERELRRWTMMEIKAHQVEVANSRYRSLPSCGSSALGEALTEWRDA